MILCRKAQDKKGTSEVTDMPWWGNLIIILAVAAAAILGIYFLNKRNQKKLNEQQEQIDASKQQISMLVIDKKKMKIKNSGMPQMVYDQMPWYGKLRKFPIVKAKVGPRIMTFIAENEVFDLIPVKTEIKATVSGLYIVDVRSIRGSLESAKKKKNKEKKESKFDILIKKGRGEM